MEEQKYYKYKGLEFLTNETSQDIATYDNIYICSYNVNTDGKYPFLRFLLSKPFINAKLSFPQMFLLTNVNSSDFLDHVQSYLYRLLMIEDTSYNKCADFNGYYEYNNDLYVFFDVTKCKLNINDIYKSNHLWLALIDEIVTYRNVCNMPVEFDVVNFLSSNEELCFLVDENEENYEIPIVSYVEKPENALNFTFIFGEPKTNKNSLLGPFYYFKDFNAAFKNGGHKSEKNGIVRFALFVGNTKFIENNLNDNSDDSEITAQRLRDENLNQNKEYLTIRIADRDGKWSQDYDSAYLGCIELDNGEFMNEHSIVVKEYNQQIPLSYHYIDKLSLHKNSDEYSIA